MKQNNRRKARTLLVLERLKLGVDASFEDVTLGALVEALDMLDAYELALALAAPGRQRMFVEVAEVLIEQECVPPWLAAEWVEEEAAPKPPEQQPL